MTSLLERPVRSGVVKPGRLTTGDCQSRPLSGISAEVHAGLSLDDLAVRAEQLSSQCTFAKVDRLGAENGSLWRWSFTGHRGGGDPIRLGLFAGIHGDEPAGPLALYDFFESLCIDPSLADGYELTFFPACNPSGVMAGTRLSSSGKDLNREFWKASSEPEIRLLEEEIRSRLFHGLISLHADDTSDGLYGFVRGAVLSRELLAPALTAAGKILPLNKSEVIDGFHARDGIISECYEGILTAPPHLDPLPFEIILETPALADLTLQRRAFTAALHSVLREYREVLSYAADL